MQFYNLQALVIGALHQGGLSMYWLATVHCNRNYIVRMDDVIMGPLTGYVKLQDAYAPGTFSPATDFKRNR